ncbi:MAG: aromatic ring-hydroxylating dioxygenase subunit alpha [Actinomycetota bacterium]
MAKTEHEVKIRNDEVEWEPRPTLSSADYASAEVWEEERERIWWGEWICVGRTEEVPNSGDHVVRDVAGESIFVLRNDAGELRAFYNVCSHRGTKFLDDIDGTQNVRKAFVCPYHAWAFDLNGQLIGSPNVKEDEHFDRSQHPLYDIAVDHYAGFMFVNMTTGGPRRSLMESLNDGAETITAFERFKMDELRIGVRLVYEVEANWKIVVENYNECLHCPQIHPELVQVIPLFRFGEVWDEEIPDDGNRMVEGATSFTKTGESQLPKFPGLEPEDYEMYYGTYQFPNLMLNLHPDSAMYYIGYPTGPNHTTVVSQFMFRPETIADSDLFKPEGTVEFWDQISKQDWEVCERAHTGVSSRAFTRGVFPRQDRFLYWFNEEWRRSMGRQTLG